MKRGYVTGSHGKMVGRSYFNGKDNDLDIVGKSITEGLLDSIDEALDKKLKTKSAGATGDSPSGRRKPTVVDTNTGKVKTGDSDKSGDGGGGGGDSSGKHSGGGGGGNKKDSSSSSSDDSSSKKEDNLIDWIEVLLKKIDRQLEMAKSSAESQD